MEGKEYREPIQIPETASGLVTVKVNCPSCHNRNRRARRACGFCNHEGTITKHVSKSEIE